MLPSLFSNRWYLQILFMTLKASLDRGEYLLRSWSFQKFSQYLLMSLIMFSSSWTAISISLKTSFWGTLGLTLIWAILLLSFLCHKNFWSNSKEFVTSSSSTDNAVICSRSFLFKINMSRGSLVAWSVASHLTMS